MKAVKSVKLVNNKVVITYVDNTTEVLFDLSTDGGTVSPEVLKELNRKLDLLTAEVESFSRLEEGSTTGDAELINGRIGYNGEVYSNIGEAIREQVNDLHEEKMQRYILRLVKEGNNYKITDYEGNDVSFNDLYSAIRDVSNYVVCLYGNSKLRPQYVSTNEMLFIGLDRASTSTKVLRLNVTPTATRYETFELTEDTEMKAYVDKAVEEKTSSLSESITNTNADLRQLDSRLSESIAEILNDELIEYDGQILLNTYASFQKSDTSCAIQRISEKKAVVYELEDDTQYLFTTDEPSDGNLGIIFSNSLFEGDTLYATKRIRFVDGSVSFINSEHFKYAYARKVTWSNDEYNPKCYAYSKLQNKINETVNNVNDLKDKSISSSTEDAEIVKNNGKFVNALTNSITTNSGYFITELYLLHRGDSVTVTSKDPSGNAVGRISKWNQDGTILDKIIDVGTKEETTVSYTATEDKEYLMFSGYKSNSFVVKVTTIIIPNSFEIAVKKVVGETDAANDIPYTVSMFEKIAVCGDSYTAGAICTRDSTLGTLTVLGFLPYGNVLHRLIGTDVTTYASSGGDTVNYQTRSECLPKLLSDEPKDLYLFALGINDYTNRSTVALGTIADIHDDYTTNPNTFYGNYGKIVSQVKAHAPKAKIVISTVFIPTFMDGVYYDFSANAVKEIADHFGGVSIDTAQNAFMCSDVYNNAVRNNGGHPNAVMYGGIANNIKTLIDDCIAKNLQYFGDYVPL